MELIIFWNHASEPFLINCIINFMQTRSEVMNFSDQSMDKNYKYLATSQWSAVPKMLDAITAAI